MSTIRIAFLAVLALGACASRESVQAADDKAARSIIANVIGPEYAGVTLTPVIDCMIDNSPPEERTALVLEALDFGVTGSVAAKVRSIELRPATRSCIAAKGVVKPRLGDI